VRTIELLVKRLPPAQHAIDNVGGDGAGGKASRFSLRVDARYGHAAHVTRPQLRRQ
jgi:hypothetical protein